MARYLAPWGNQHFLKFLQAVQVWEVETGRRLPSPARHSKAVKCVSFHPDGRSFATSSTDTTLRVWDTATGKQLWVGGHTGKDGCCCGWPRNPTPYQFQPDAKCPVVGHVRQVPPTLAERPNGPVFGAISPLQLLEYEVLGR